MGYISNVINDLANIVIQTELEYRNQGLATKVVEKISRECINHGLIPIYWVNVKNKSSKKVAENLNFKVIGKEIVLYIK